MFVFLGRVSRASVSARAPCAKSSTSRAARREAASGGGTRPEELEGDGEAGWEGIAEGDEGNRGNRGEEGSWV